MPDEVEPFPERDRSDLGYGTVQIVLNGVPFVGGSLSRALDEVFTPSLERRRGRWAQEVADLVAELGRDQVTPAQLSEDEAWITAVAQASSVALGTHLEEKLAVLKSLLRTYAIRADRDTFAVSRFIRLVDELEPFHFSLLKFARDPIEWRQAAGTNLPESGSSPLGLAEIFSASGLQTDSQTAVTALRDLEGRWLVKVPRETNGDWSNEFLRSGWPFVLEAGRQFLDWVDVFE